MASSPDDSDAAESQHRGAAGDALTRLSAREGRGLEVCEIVRWRGYVTCEFYARRSPGGEVLATSGAFRWRKSAPPPDRGRAREAYERLTTRLNAEGWEESGRGSAWYERRFARELPGHAIDAAATTEPTPAAPQPTATIVERWPVVVAAAPPAPAGPSGVIRPSVSEPVQPPADVDDRVAHPLTESPAKAHGDRRGRRRLGLFSIGVALIATLAAGGWIVAGRPAHIDAATKLTQPVVRPHARVSSTTSAVAERASAVAESTPASPSARLTVKGIGDGSWVEVRRDSARGRVLFSGVVKGGKAIDLQAPRLWVRFGAAARLVITVNGAVRPLSGTVDALVTPTGLAKP